MAEPLRKADRPPEKGPRFWVYRVKTGAGFLGQIVSPTIWGVFTHWDGNTTRECYADRKKCPLCIDGCGNRWKGYLYVYNSLNKEFGFLELTPDAAEEVWRQCGRDEPLRGWNIRAKRHGGNKGKILVEMSFPNGFELDRLPQPQDPEETLRMLWTWKKRA